MNLSDHFTLSEAILSQTGERLGLDNTPIGAVYNVMVKTAVGMEKIRAILDNRPIIISSWYRSPAVNKAVGGVWNSQHITGEAVDFICPGFGSPADICTEILKHPEVIRFDQLILEHTWVHVSFTSVPGVKNRGQVLSLLSNGGYANGLTDKKGTPL